MFVAIRPVSFASTATATSSSKASNPRSGATFTNSGRVASTCRIAARISRNAPASWSDRNPGVLGEETLTTK